MTVAYGVSVWRQNNAFVDVFYGLTIIFVATNSYIAFSDGSMLQWLVTFLVTVWGVRLTVRSVSRYGLTDEGWRYSSFRDEWKKRGALYFAVRSYVQIYMLRSLVIWVVLLPVVFINSFVATAIHDVAFFGVIVWIVGFLLEAVSEYQLDNFKRDPANNGRVFTGGLYKYSRRINYFGEALMWWGIFIMTLEHPMGEITMASPVLLTALLYFVAGPIVDDKLKESSEEYRTFASYTSYFIPMQSPVPHIFTRFK